MGLKAVATLVAGGGAPIGGSGTAGTIPKWDTTTTLNDSVITQSGLNIGINQAVPGYSIDAVSAGASLLRLTRTALNSFDAVITSVMTGTGAGDLLWATLQGDGGFAWRVNNGTTFAMGITETGNVGIGTASPTRMLTLSATDATIGPAVTQTTVIRLVNPATVVGTGSGIQFSHDNNNGQTLAQISEVLTSVANQWTGDLAISLKATSAATTLTEYVRFQSGGNVGIGTPSPGCALDVVGVIKTSGYTVATLPAGAVGQRAYVTDATLPTYLGALVGGGAVYAPVFHNGTAWVSA